MKLGPYIRNHKNAKRLINWLINGSDDEYFFSIYYGHSDFESPRGLEILPEDLHDSQPECGTICCIAGMAAIMAGDRATCWQERQEIALNWLGISPTEEFLWTLFDADYYRERNIRPTGQNCADALIEYSHTGEIPWD